MRLRQWDDEALRSGNKIAQHAPRLLLPPFALALIAPALLLACGSNAPTARPADTGAKLDATYPFSIERRPSCR